MLKNKRIMVFIFLILALMIMQTSFASEDVNLNHINETAALDVGEDASDVLSDSGIFTGTYDENSGSVEIKKSHTGNLPLIKENQSDRLNTTLDVTPVVGGSNVTIYVHVNPNLAEGNVTFYLNRNRVINLVNGEGNFTVSNLANDDYTITCYYTGDTDYAPSNKTVSFTISNRDDSILTANVVVRKQNVVLNFEINHNNAGGNITFKINDEEKTVNVTRGKATVSLDNVDYNNYSIILTYSGDRNYKPSTYILDFKVVYTPYDEILYVSKNGNDSNNATSNFPLLTIKKAVEIANTYDNVKKIYIYNGIYSDSDMSVDANITVEGQSKFNTVIDAGGKSIFTVLNSTSINITKLTLKNAYNENGGAVNDYCNFLNISDCVFINNTAYGNGGAIFHFTGSIFILNSEFIQNTADAGGAVYSSADTEFSVEIINCTFTKNSASGGAVYSDSEMLINNSIFTANSAGNGSGAAIFNRKHLIINNSEFMDNHACFEGGAIKSAGNAEVYNSNFTDNTAGVCGGSVHISHSQTTVRNSLFKNNYADNGGAVYISLNSTNIDKCIFINNTAKAGGAVYLNCTSGVISNSYFEKNNADSGGAIAVVHSAVENKDYSITLTSNSYINNSATNGGAIYSNAGSAASQELNIEYSEFVNNTAGGQGTIIYTTNRANIEYNAILYNILNDNVIYVGSGCEGIVSLENNWWGVNSPLLSKIIRGINAPVNYAVLNLSANPEKVEKSEETLINAGLFWINGTQKNVDLIPNRSISLSVPGGNLKLSKGTLTPNFTTVYSNNDSGTYTVIATVDGEIQYVTVSVVGDALKRSEVYVNASNGDDKFGDGSQQNPVKTISKAVDLALDGGTIILNGYFSGTGNNRIALYQTFGNNLTFFGVNNTVIDGEDSYFLFWISTGNYEFVNLTLQNAYYAGYGAAITNEGNILVRNCTFRGNVAQGSPAIDNTGSAIVIGCEFRDNIATWYDGGAMSSSYELAVVNSTFINNHAYRNGGAIKDYEGGYLYVESCEFNGNYAGGNSEGSYGGAVYAWASDINIFSSRFSDNYAASKGGAVYSSYGNSYGYYDCYIYSSEFEDNDAARGATLFLESVAGEIRYNVFLDEMDVVYGDGNYAPVDYNWWGVNDPDWAMLLTGYISAPKVYAVLNVSANPKVVAAGFDSILDYAFYWSGTDDRNGTGYIPQRIIDVTTPDGEIRGNLTNATFTTTFSPDSTGNYQITANVDKEILKINVTVKNPALIISDAVVQKDNVTVSVSMNPSDATGEVTFNLNNRKYTIPLVDGKGNVTVSGLSNAQYNIVLNYSGDDNYPYSNTTLSFKISNIIKNASSVKVDIKVDGQNNNLLVNVSVSPNNAEGNVSFTIGGKEYILALVNSKAGITISNLSVGNYNLNVKYSGDDYFNESISDTVSFTIAEGLKGVILLAPEMEKYYKGSDRFHVYLRDLSGNRLSGQVIYITVNGNTYNRVSDKNGSVSLAINLNSGVYEIPVEFRGNDEYASAKLNSTIVVKSTVNASDITKIYRNATQYYATFRDSQGNYLADGTAVRFNINGVFYERRVSGNQGQARLNINLEQGTYILTATNLETGENYASNIYVLPNIVKNNDLTKYYKNASQYVVEILGDDGKSVGSGVNVSFNINGVFYTRTTNESGLAKININLQPGNYVITAEYKGCKVSNNIAVRSVLSASDLKMNYHDGSQFEARLLDGQGRPLTNTGVGFNINGVFYNRLTDGDGIAHLNINLMRGEYIITSSYNGENTANTITIS